MVLVNKSFLASRLKDCRESKGLSMEDMICELSKIDIRVSRATLSSWESGVTEPDPSLLFVLASFFKRPIQYFFASKIK